MNFQCKAYTDKHYSTKIESRCIYRYSPRDMSRLQKKIIPTEEDRTLVIVSRYSRVYKKRLGIYRYVVVFPFFPTISGYKQGLMITDEERNGIPYGIFDKVVEADINGTLLKVEEIPEKIFNLIKRELRHGGYM